MNPVVDPTFSVYQLLQRNYEQKHIIRHRKTMSQISLEIEDASGDIGGMSRIFAGFQYFSKFLPQIEHYRALAKNVESIFVFGVPDVELPVIDRVTYIRLSPSVQLAKEWFVVSYGKTYNSLLATEEISDITDADQQRVFDGVWTFNPFIVSLIGDWIGSAVDARPIRNEVSDVTHQQHIENTIKSLNHLIVRIDQMDSFMLSDRLIILRHELRRTVEEELQPTLEMAF